MENVNTMVQPIPIPRNVYAREVKGLTSGRAGKIIPLMAGMIKREDGLKASRLSVKIEADEMVEAIMNGQGVRVQVTLVPFPAFERFGSLDAFNWAYMGVPNTHTGVVAPLFQMVPTVGEFWNTLGVHAPLDGGTRKANSMALEAYNAYVNWRYSMVSKRLAARTALDTTLARAPWMDPLTGVIVPDYEQAIIDGEVALALSGRVDVKGIWQTQATGTAASASVFKDASGATGTPSQLGAVDKDGNPLNAYLAGDQYFAAKYLDQNGDGTISPSEVFPNVWADLAQANGVVTLAAINQARNTARFAQMREQIVKKYGKSVDDDLDIAFTDMLMEGIAVPHEFERMPQVLAQVVTRMGMNRRWATDGDNLDKAVTTGGTIVEMMVSCPRVNAGGVLLVTAEIMPEPIREERPLPEFIVDTRDDLPNALRDINNPYQVKAVTNFEMTAYHSQPDALFGYEPMNNHWRNPIIAIGGRYKYDPADTWKQDRQRFWKVDVVDPVLTDDFYLCPEDMPHDPFADRTVDPFTFITIGTLRYDSLTQFGRRLIENNGEYEITAQVSMAGAQVQEVR